MVVVETGSVRARDWEDRDGNKRRSIERDVDDCAPSLRWAQAQIERTSRGGGGGGGGGFSDGGSSGGGGGGGRQPDPVYGDEEPF